MYDLKYACQFLYPCQITSQGYSRDNCICTQKMILLATFITQVLSVQHVVALLYRQYIVYNGCVRGFKVFKIVNRYGSGQSESLIWSRDASNFLYKELFCTVSKPVLSESARSKDLSFHCTTVTCTVWNKGSHFHLDLDYSLCPSPF